MSSRYTLRCLSNKRKNIFLLCQAMMKQSLALVSDISTIIKVSVTVISLSLDYSGYHKNLIQSLFIICRKKVENNIPLSSMAFQMSNWLCCDENRQKHKHLFDKRVAQLCI